MEHGKHASEAYGQHGIHSYPRSLPEFQRMFPDDAACAAYLEKARWASGFVCPNCKTAGEPYRIATRPRVLRCRKCRHDTGLTAGTVMKDTHTPLSVWFWAAYLVASQTPGMSAVQFQRQLGLTRYETAFQILHKLRAGMVRPDQDRIGGLPDGHVEADEAWVGAGRCAGRVRLVVVPDRSADSLCGFIKSAIVPQTMVVTDGWDGYRGLGGLGFKPIAIPARGDPEIAEASLPMIHLVFSNLKTWLKGIHHGVSQQHLQAYLNEFTFRFNRRFSPFNAFRSLLGIAADAPAPTYADLYSGQWRHPTPFSGRC